MAAILKPKEAASLVIDEIKKLGPGKHEIPGNEFAKLVATKRGLANKNHPTQWVPTVQILKEILGNNIILPDKHYTKQSRVIIINPESLEDEKEKEENRIIFLTYKFNALAKCNRRENLLILSEKDMIDMGTSEEEILKLISFLEVKEATLVPDGAGNFNFQGFDFFIKGLRSEEIKIQSKKRKKTIDAILDEGWLDDSSQLCKDLIAFFKSYDPVTQKIDPNLVTPEIIKFWGDQTRLSSISLPDPGKPYLYYKTKKTPTSIPQTLLLIKTIFEQEDNCSKKRVSDFMIFQFLQISGGVVSLLDLDIVHIDKDEISYSVEITIDDLEKISKLLQKLQEQKEIFVSNINIDLNNDKMKINLVYKPNELVFRWITN